MQIDLSIFLLKRAVEVFGRLIVEFFCWQVEEIVCGTGAHQFYYMTCVLLCSSSRNGLALIAHVERWKRPTDMIEALVGASDGRVCLIELQGSLTVEGKIIGVGDYLVSSFCRLSGAVKVK